MINFILFIVMACYALCINYSWYKQYNEMKNWMRSRMKLDNYTRYFHKSFNET